MDGFQRYSVLNVGSFLIKGTLFVNNQIRPKMQCFFPCVV